jgi:16S rRNA (adenine1518-N6/adenine1519-N6)-dimethyltransferase
VPNVDSALVFFAKRPTQLGDESLRLAVFEAIDSAFAQRRKTLRQALADWAGSAADAERILLAAGIDPKLRGEQLSIHDFVAIARAKR